MWLWLWLLLIFVLVILAEYVYTILQLRRTGAQLLLGPPLLYRLPLLLFNRDSLYDKLVADMEGVPGQMLATRRSPVSPIVLISANPEVNQYILDRRTHISKALTCL